MRCSLAATCLGRKGKQFVSQDGIVEVVQALLADIQSSLLEDARAFRDAHITDAATYDELRSVIEAGDWARVFWDGTDDDEVAVKDETGATIRCFPFDKPIEPGQLCSFWTRHGEQVALFAKAY